jgi:hypothetical protein
VLAYRKRETVVRESFVVPASFMMQGADEVKLAGDVRMMSAIRILSRCESQKRLSEGGVVMIPLINHRGWFRFRCLRTLAACSIEVDPPQSNVYAVARRSCAAIQCRDYRDRQVEEPLG